MKAIKVILIILSLILLIICIFRLIWVVFPGGTDYNCLEQIATNYCQTQNMTYIDSYYENVFSMFNDEYIFDCMIFNPNKYDRKIGEEKINSFKYLEHELIKCERKGWFEE